MNASAIRNGDLFVEISPEDWAKLSPRKQREIPVRTAKSDPGLCSAYRDRVHIRTSAGSWCIPAVAPVALLAEEKALPGTVAA